MKRYDGQVAVVTGASSGLGRQMALDLAARGATVVGIARRQELLEQLGTGFVVCDVADTEAYRSVLEKVHADHGRIDVLIQSQGMEQRTHVEDADFDLYPRTFATNFFSVVAGALAVVPGMLERAAGVVVNISSDHGRAPGPMTPAYSASKAAVSAFTESLAHEVHGRGVHLHVLYPGWVPTALGQGAVEGGMPPPPKAVRRTAEQVSRLTLERMGGRHFEINAARIATLAPVTRALLPAVYRRVMVKQRGD